MNGETNERASNLIFSLNLEKKNNNLEKNDCNKIRRIQAQTSETIS